MLPRLSFGLVATWTALVAVQSVCAFPFGSSLTVRDTHDHSELAKRITVTNMQECYAACDSIFPDRNKRIKRVEFSFSTHRGCMDGCNANVKAPKGGKHAAVEQGPDGPKYHNPDWQGKRPSSSPEAPKPSETSQPQPDPQPDPQPSTPASGPPASGNQAWVDAHNAARAKYHAPPVAWSDELAGFAANYASQCNWAHSGGPYGENLAGSTGGMSPEAAVNMWVGEASQFDFNNGGFSKATGHFTQVVWKGTTEIGCVTHNCEGGSARGSFLICEYKPPGNYGGQYRENVQAA